MADDSAASQIMKGYDSNTGASGGWWGALARRLQGKSQAAPNPAPSPNGSPKPKADD